MLKHRIFIAPHALTLGYTICFICSENSRPISIFLACAEKVIQREIVCGDSLLFMSLKDILNLKTEENYTIHTPQYKNNILKRICIHCNEIIITEEEIIELNKK